MSLSKHFDDLDNLITNKRPVSEIKGKRGYSVTLTEKNVKRAKRRETNFSGLLDRLLASWLA